MYPARRLFSLLLLLLFPSPLLHAADLHWTGSASTDWSNPANWLEGQVPTPADNAYIPTDATPLLTAPILLANLTLSPFARVTVTNTSLTISDTLSLAPDATLTASGNLVVPTINDQGALIAGAGTLNLSAPAGSPLNLLGAGNLATSDLNSLFREPVQRQLNITSPLSGPLNLSIFGDGAINFASPWTAGPSAKIGLTAPYYQATLGGAPFTLKGRLTGPNEVRSVATVSAPVTLAPASLLSIPYGSLQLDHATFAGGTVSGGVFSHLFLTNPADVTADTTLDHLALAGDLNIQPGVTVNFIAQHGLTYDRGTLNLLHDATLLFNPTGFGTYNQWHPTAILLHDGATVSGLPFTSFGWQLTALDGLSTVSNDLRTDAGTLAVAAGAELRLTGNVTLDSFYETEPSPGTLRFQNTLTITGANTNLTVATLDLDGNPADPTTLTIPDSTALTLNTDTLDPDDGSFDGTLNDHTRFTVNTPSPWTAGPASSLNLLGSHAYQSPRPTIAGSPFTARGPITADAWESQIIADFTSDGASLNVPFGTLYLPARLSILSSLTKTGLGTLRITGPQSHAPGSALLNASGTLELDTDAGSPTARNLALQTTGSSSTFYYASQHLASLNLADTSLLSADPYNKPDTLLVTNTLAIAGSAAIDLERGALIVLTPGSTAPSIRSYLAAGYNGGTWTGPGIRSSYAANDPPRLSSVGYAQASDLPLASYRDQPLDPASILIRFTFAADANLDFLVEDDDLARLDNGYNHHLTGWSNGDFNYDATIDANDYLIFYRTYLLLGHQLTPATYSQIESRFGPSFLAALTATIPEPVTPLIPLLLFIPFRRPKIHRHLNFSKIYHNSI